MRNSRKISVSVAAASAAALLLAASGVARATAYNWVGNDPGSANWANVLNWDGLFTVPGATDTIAFANSIATRSQMDVSDVRHAYSAEISGFSLAAGNWVWHGSAPPSHIIISSTIQLDSSAGATDATFNGGLEVDAAQVSILNGAELNVNGGATMFAPTVMSGFSVLSLSGGGYLNGNLSQAGNSSSIAQFSGASADSSIMELLGGGRLNIINGSTVNIGQQYRIINGSSTVDATSALNIASSGSIQVANTGVFHPNGGKGLSDNTSLVITNGGVVSADSYFDIGNARIGTLSVDGSTSSISAGAITDWGAGVGFATVTLSNSAAGTYSSLRIGNSGGSANVQLLTSSTLATTSSLLMGGAGSHGTLLLNVNGGTLTGNGTSEFDNGSSVKLLAGGITFNGDGTFASGSTLNWTGGNLSIASGHTLNFASGVGTFAVGTGLSNSATLRISNGGQVTNSSYLDIGSTADGGANGTLTIDGTNSKYISLNSYTDFGLNAGDSGTLAISNSGAATYGALHMATNGGHALFNLQSGGMLNVTTEMTAGGSVSGSAATINIAGGTLNNTGVGNYNKGTNVALSSGGLVVGGDATFATGSNLNWTGGALSIASGHTLTFNGSTGTFGVGTGLGNGATIHITNGAQVINSSYLDIGSSNDGGATATLTIDGTGSKYTAAGAYSDLGLNIGNFGTLNISSSGAASFNGGLHLAGSGGQALLNVSGGSITVNGLSAGSSVAGSAATINVTGGGSFNSTGTSLFNNVASLTVSGAIGQFSAFNSVGNATFLTGSSASVSGFGTFTMGPATTLAFDGGVGTFTSGDFNLVNNGTLRVTAGGKFFDSGEINIASGQATGTLLADGTNSVLSTTTPFPSGWGLNAGNSAVATFSNGAVGTYSNALTLAQNGGSATLNVLSGARLSAGTLVTGAVGGSGTTSITVNNATLTIGGGTFGNHSTVNVTGTGVLAVNGNATFSAGSTLNAPQFNDVPLAANTTLAFDGGVGTLNGFFNGLQNGQALRVTSGGQVTLQSAIIALAGGNGSLFVDGTNSKFFDLASTESWGQGSVATITFSNGGAGTVSGNVQLGSQSQALLNITNGGLFEAAGIFTSFGGGSATINVNGGTLRTTGGSNINGGGTLTYSAGTINIGGTLGVGITAGNALVSLTTGGNKVLRAGGLDIENSGKIDLSDNDMIVDYTGGSPLSTVTGYLVTGRNGGNWLGGKLTSSAAAANSTHTALGIGEASTVLGASGGTFSGQAVDGTTVLVKYTYLGDTNLDGKVDITDLGNLASHWQQTGQLWTSGDFNYDGKVDITDLGVLATNWQAGVGNPLISFNDALAEVAAQTGSSVPEPASLTMVMLGMAGLAARRRR